MAKMDVLRRANQQARRLKAAGVDNDALSKFLTDKKTFKANLRGKKLSKALRKAAREFVSKKSSTISGIKSSWTKGVKSGRISVKAAAAIGDNVGKMAKYLNYGAESRRWLEAKSLGMASDQIKFLYDAMAETYLTGSARKQKFMQILSEVTDIIYKNNGVAPDVITNLILDKVSPYIRE